VHTFRLFCERMKMTKNLVTLKYKDHLITFNKDGWINATKVASRYGKLPSEWARLPETERYIGALIDYLNAGKSHVIDRSSVYLAVRGKGGGTWLHPKLAVAFARWLDVDFAVWCDMQIDEMLFGKGRAMQNLLEATKALDNQIKKGSDAGRGLAMHKYAKPPLEAQVEYWRNEVQLSLGFEP
jgi:hypothetical protein